MSDARSDSLQDRILSLLDGELGADGIRQLDAELKASREARDLFRKLATLHSSLEEQGESRTQLGRTLIPMERLLEDQRRAMVRNSLAAAAAVLMISAIVLWVRMVPGVPPTIADFRVGPDASFILTHAKDGEGSPQGMVLAEGSSLYLSQGTIELNLVSGVCSVVEGPAQLELLAGDLVRLQEGRAWFEVPPPAVGFTVETTRLSVVDLGTRFGVVASVDGEQEVHVIEGSVEVAIRNSDGARERLIESEGRRLEVNGRLSKIEARIDRFATSFHESIEIKNPGFESPRMNPDEAGPDGYGLITNWASRGPGVGVSDGAQPFLNQPPHSGNHVAFIQGSGMISQSVSGLNPSKRYTVTYFVSERGLPGAATSTSVSMDLGESIYRPSDKIVRTDAFRRVVSGPLTVSGTTANVQISASAVSGDASLLVDSVSVSRSVPSVADGGFESPVQPSGVFKQISGQGDGVLTDSAWRFVGGGGISANGSDFSPPPAPEGSQVAVLQNQGAGFSAVVGGLEPGATYRLAFASAGRRGGAASFEVKLGEAPLEFDGKQALLPVVDSYTLFTSDEFVAVSRDLMLSFGATTEGTSFIDDIHFEFVAEPTN